MFKHYYHRNRWQNHCVQVCVTLTVIFPALYWLSSSGSSAGRSGNSKPSTSGHSSARPSRVTIPGLNWAEIWASSSGSQCHSPDSSWEAASTRRQEITRWGRWKRRRWSHMVIRQRRRIGFGSSKFCFAGVMKISEEKTMGGAIVDLFGTYSINSN